MVTYRVKPEAAERNAELVRAVFAELAEVRPEGFSYACFVLEDGVSFVHIAAGEFALTELPAFQAFLADHASRREAPPVTSSLTEVGAYQSAVSSSTS
jgi:hypothetical protein